jgi:hypothetical protein
MRMKPAHLLACAMSLCSAVGAASPIAMSAQAMSAQAWLSRVPPLPATADAAYAQWVDISGGLKPGPASDQVSGGIKAEVLSLSRPVEPPASSGGPLSAHDQVLTGKISVFPDTAAVLQRIQAARVVQAALLQKWHAELNALEQQRVKARGALPACHNEAGTPSQASIRDVEQSFSQQKIEIAVRYLAQFQPLLDQLLAAVSPRIAHGDAVMDAWTKLRSQSKKAELAPLAHGSENDALLDVALVQNSIQDVSKLAARSISERNALGRVYANAKGC